MTRSSKTRKAKVRTRKFAAKNRIYSYTENAEEALLDPSKFTKADKRYLIAFTFLSLIITAFYFSLGGRNIFVFPALICMSVGARKYWSGPIRRFADEE